LSMITSQLRSSRKLIVQWWRNLVTEVCGPKWTLVFMSVHHLEEGRLGDRGRIGSKDA
jgi:hypothetical protein